MISFYNWIIQFRKDQNDLGVVGSFLFTDSNFTNDIDTYEKLHTFLKNNVKDDTQLRVRIRASFRQYKEKIQA